MPAGYVHFEAVASSRAEPRDRVAAFERGDRLVLVVADGAGSIRGGATASQAVVDAVRGAIADPAFVLDDVRAWGDLLKGVDGKLTASLAGETTAVVVSLGPSGIVGVSAGDSEAWVVTPARVEDLTQSQDTKRKIGGGHVTPAPFERHALKGVLLIASDGLFKYASREVIARIVRSVPVSRAIEELVALVRLPSGRFADDVAVAGAARDAAGLSSPASNSDPESAPHR
jgi:serine/threonine protein phosphatase PrpC